MDLAGVTSDVLLKMRFLGYDETCMTYVRVGFNGVEYVYDRMPTVDDFNGVRQSVLDLYVRDLVRVLREVNMER